MTEDLTITSFDFESDFMEDDIRCIPMIVRFKLDACGIKLKLAEWSRMNSDEREILATSPCDNDAAAIRYRKYLQHLVRYRTGREATPLDIPVNPPWSILSQIPDILTQKLRESNYTISLPQWQDLTVLQRFALIKLASSNHEHKNFSKALKEFNLV